MQGGLGTRWGRNAPFLVGRSASLMPLRLVKLLEDCRRASERVMRGGSMKSDLSLISRPNTSPSRQKTQSEAVLVLTRQSEGNANAIVIKQQQSHSRPIAVGVHPAAAAGRALLC